jgi:hypothetical protein
VATVSNPTKRDLLELDIDFRLADLWRELDNQAFDRRMSPQQIELVAIFMRAAYGKGYCDALVEPEEERGSLCSDNGYRVPPRRIRHLRVA